MKSTTTKALQVWAGKAVHILQFRRCLLEEVFAVILRTDRSQTQEMLVVEALLPVVQCDLKAAVDPVITCSDASETGGGMCFSSRLTWAGREEAERLMDNGPEEPVVDDTEMQGEKPVLIVDLFCRHWWALGGGAQGRSQASLLGLCGAG